MHRPRVISTFLPFRQNNPAQIRGRSIHLLHQMFTKHPVISQLGSIRKKTVPSADQIYLRLYDVEEKDLGTMTLPQALQRIEPLFHLSQREPGVYQIKALRMFENTTLYGKEWDKGGKKNKHFTRSGRSKDMPLQTVVTPSRLLQVLSAAHKNLIRGARVEFRLAQKTRPADGAKTVDWALANALHLRPDTIMAAMPAGTTMLARPCYAHDEPDVIMWALEYAPALERAHSPTPPSVLKMGAWRNHVSLNRYLEERYGHFQHKFAVRSKPKAAKKSGGLKS